MGVIELPLNGSGKTKPILYSETILEGLGNAQQTAYVNYNIKSSNQLNSDIINRSFVPFWNVLLNL
jgi:hypothetical protein